MAKKRGGGEGGYGEGGWGVGSDIVDVRPLSSYNSAAFRGGEGGMGREGVATQARDGQEWPGNGRTCGTDVEECNRKSTKTKIYMLDQLPIMTATKLCQRVRVEK